MKRRIGETGKIGREGQLTNEDVRSS